MKYAFPLFWYSNFCSFNLPPLTFAYRSLKKALILITNAFPLIRNKHLLFQECQPPSTPGMERDHAIFSSIVSYQDIRTGSVERQLEPIMCRKYASLPWQRLYENKSLLLWRVTILFWEQMESQKRFLINERWGKEIYKYLLIQGCTEWYFNLIYIYK